MFPLENTVLLLIESPLLLNILFESREKVPIGNRPDVFVALEEPYTLLKVDDLSCKRGKSDPNRELDVERLLKLLNAWDFPKKTITD